LTISTSEVAGIGPARGPGRPRSQASEAAILDATLLILAQEGYTGLTTDKIAAVARASKSTIYRRWPSKEHMVLAAFDRTPVLNPRDTGRLIDDLLDIVMQLVRLIQHTPLGGALPALISERAHNPQLAAALDPVIARRREPTKIILGGAIARGDLPAGTDLELATDMIWGPVMLRTIILPGDVSEGAMRELLEAVVRGLRDTGVRSA
jgi:AcrR family transcriptional regulator